ncbi:MAG: ankyrin repeat domain-containing protein [Lentimicrobiaceae bacterium]|nr:ankyrin repeat domain-containing protein [Lentimicrobiaceae bacterium]
MQTYEIKRLYEQNAQQEEILNAYQTAFAEKGNDYGAELITNAASFADIRALKFLIDSGIDPLTQDHYGFTLLHQLAKLEESRDYVPSREDVKESATFLLNQHVSVLRKDENENMCCFHYAARKGNYPFIETLVEHGARLTMTDKEGNTAVHIACDYVRHQISNMEYAEKAVVDAKIKLEKAATLSDSWKKSAEKDLEEANNRLQKTNHLIENYFLIVKTLSENGVDKDEKNQYGKTALEMAIHSNAKKIAAYLSGENTDEMSVKSGGMNLHQAIIKGDLEALAALLQNGADPNALLDGEPADESKKHIGSTPLAVACDYKNVEAVKLLLQHAATPNYKNIAGKAPVVYLTSTTISMQKVFEEKRIGQILKLLIDAGYNIDETVDEEANTLISYTLRYGNYAYISRFLAEAVILDEALRYRPNLNLANLAGQTPLMFVCRTELDKMENTMLSLLENDVDVNLRDNEGNTALHYAAQNSSKNTAKTFCELLLDFKADANIANNTGKTVMDIAVENENEPLVKMLLSKV